MAVGFDAKMTAGNSGDGFNQNISGATAISSTGITVGASAKILVATFTLQSNTNTNMSNLAVTWNGVSLTVITPTTVGAGTDRTTAAIAYLINPAAGAQTLAATWTTSADCYMGAVSFTGSDTSTGIASGDTTSATATTGITVTSTTDGATVAVFSVDGSPPTVNQTKLWADAPFNPGGGASYALGGTSNSHTFTGAGGTQQALAGIHIIAASGGETITLDKWFRAVPDVARRRVGMVPSGTIGIKA